MEMKIETTKLSDGTLQIGYKTSQGWIGITNLYRSQDGWVSDNYSGWKKTIAEWKIFIKSEKSDNI